MEIIKKKGKAPKDTGITDSGGEGRGKSKQEPSKGSTRPQDEKSPKTDERLGELRKMAEQNEKEIKMIKDSVARAIEVLSRADADIKKEMEDIRLRFKGLEAEKPSKDLAAMKAVQFRVESDSGMVKKVSADMQKKYSEMQKLKDTVNSLSNSFKETMKELNNVRAKAASSLDREEIEEIKNLLKEKENLMSMPKGEIKSMKDFIAKSGYMEKYVSDLKGKLDDMVNVIELFTSKVNSVQKEVSEIKTKASEKAGEKPKVLPEIASRLQKIEKDSSELRERVEDIEDFLEKMSERLKAPRPERAEQEMKDLTGRISGMEAGAKGIEKKIQALSDDFSKLREMVPKEGLDAGRSANERLDSMDSRITGMHDKLMQLGGDMQKLSDYFMEGIKYMEERVRAMEREKEAEEQVKTAPPPEFIPTTYRSHLKTPREEIPQEFQADEPSEPEIVVPRKQPRPLPMGPRVELPLPPAPVRGNIFTKLREDTVVRKPYTGEDSDTHDLDILMEHIMEGMRRRESREKITRDLMNAGFEKELIDRAFMQARVG